MEPSTEFVRLGDEAVGYQVFGTGAVDVVFMSGLSGQVDVRWEEPSFAYFLDRLAESSRVILFDRRGCGVSDRPRNTDMPHWETTVEDLVAVLDAAGARRAVLFANLDSGPAALLFAVSHPHRVQGLVLANTTACFLAHPGYPHGMSQEVAEALLGVIDSAWGTERFVDFVAPNRAHEPAYRQWLAKYLRASHTPREAASYFRRLFELDVRELLPSVAAPTLVLHREDFPFVSVEHGRFLAEGITDSSLVVLAGTEPLVPASDIDVLLSHLDAFLVSLSAVQAPRRAVTTVMFSDIVGSTAHALRSGDARWRKHLHLHQVTAQRMVERHLGTVVTTAGDGLMATFASPARALLCAQALRHEAAAQGLSLRIGMHTGEVEGSGVDISGIAIHVAARVAALAEPQEVLVSRTLRDLVAGSAFEFSRRGTFDLKGFPGGWELHSVQPSTP